LRERREDLPLLVHHFLAKHQRALVPITGIEQEALDLLAQFDWPGNVRELENVIESSLALARGPLLRAADLCLPERGLPRAAPPPSAALELSLDAYERCALERALEESGGDAAVAARRLGVGRSTFYRKLSQHGLRPAPARQRPNLERAVHPEET